jgi:hypothetical protein
MHLVEYKEVIRSNPPKIKLSLIAHPALLISKINCDEV